MNIEVKTSILEGDRILQVVDTKFDEVKNMLIQTVYDTREKQFKAALISLGWTPPKEKHGE